MARRKSKKLTVMLPAWVVVIIVIASIAFYFFYLKDHIGSDTDKNGNNGNFSAATPAGFENLPEGGNGNNGNFSAATPAGFENLPEGGNGNLNIYFLDVGQGDCMIIKFPDNKTMIIDSGNVSSSNKQKIKQFTDLLNITVFDYLLLTHADADHVGNFDYVFENYEVKKVFRPNVLSTHANAANLNEGINVGFSKAQGGTEATSKIYCDFLLGLQNEEGCEDVVFNKDSDFGGTYTEGGRDYEYTFDFLTPVAEITDIKYKNANDYSPIVSLTYNGTVILLTGDAESVMENEFLNGYKNNYPDCDLIKIGHHGAETSSKQEFLSAVKPEYAVIQCGVTTSYKHPRQLILDRLQAMQTSVYRTDTNGDIAVSVSYADDYKFSSDKIYCVKSDMTENYIGGDTVYNNSHS
ncbi:MAG: MBL fold metallo-hydrolase [Clostridia bacterium]|nr:MBL fold metallo-hydrolase [Clostridia bacterium]